MVLSAAFFKKKMTNRKGEEHLESKIIIRSYPPDTTEKDLRIMFEKYGKIDDCKLFFLRSIVYLQRYLHLET